MSKRILLVVAFASAAACASALLSTNATAYLPGPNGPGYMEGVGAPAPDWSDVRIGPGYTEGVSAPAPEPWDWRNDPDAISEAAKVAAGVPLPEEAYDYTPGSAALPLENSGWGSSRGSLEDALNVAGGDFGEPAGRLHDGAADPALALRCPGFMPRKAAEKISAIIPRSPGSVPSA